MGPWGEVDPRYLKMLGSARAGWQEPTLRGWSLPDLDLAGCEASPVMDIPMERQAKVAFSTELVRQEATLAPAHHAGQGKEGEIKPSEEESSSGVAVPRSHPAVPGKPRLKGLVTVGMPQLSCTHHLSGHLDPSSHQRLLMKTGLILIVIGHLNFIAGAFIHGIILCFMANPQDTTSLQYLVSNLVVSALLVPQGTGAQEDAGVDAGVHTLDTVWMGMDAGCAHVGHGVDAGRSLGSLSCLLGLPLSTGLVLGSWCQVLLAPCTFTDMTFIQSSLLSLWTFSLVLDLVQIVFSIRCLLLSLSTLCPGRCCRRIHRKKETLRLH
nr:PREDICTED: transmembrane protein 54 [Apteryx mantelli mantelli]